MAAGLVTLSSCSSAGKVKFDNPALDYNYKKLKLLDLDEITDLVENRMQRYKKTDRAAFLTEAIQICFARTNEDGVIEKVVDIIRYGVESTDRWEQAIEVIVDNSISALQQETTAPSDQVTYLILLQNLISEFKPHFEKQYESPKFEASIIEKIALADLQVSGPAKKEVQLNLMKILSSPSELAQSLVEKRQQVLLKKNKSKKQ